MVVPRTAAEALRALPFLPPRATLAQFLEQTQAALAYLGWKQHALKIASVTREWPQRFEPGRDGLRLCFQFLFTGLQARLLGGDVDKRFVPLADRSPNAPGDISPKLYTPPKFTVKSAVSGKWLTSPPNFTM